MHKKLRRGYTTGVHALLALCSALDVFLRVGGVVVSKTNKMDNDDLDVTKGAEIVVTLSEDFSSLDLNPHPQTPFIFGRVKIFAGVGVGVVTKDGLKVPKGYPAINPTPLKAIRNCLEIFKSKREIFCTLSVTDGELLAKQTANSKVGVVGGLSILGTSGFVKPVSNVAFLESIRAEISVALAEGYENIVLTLGNSSLKVAQKEFKQTQIIEIGNFIHDAISIAKEEGAKSVTLILGSAKALKVAQGFKNTHNRFGEIDFEALKLDIFKQWGVEIDTKSTKTLKGVLEQLQKVALESKLKDFIKQKAEEQIREWFGDFVVEVQTL